VIINRAVGEVFADATNADRIPEWQPWIEQAWHTPEGPAQVGTTVHVINRFLGRASEARSVVTEYRSNTIMVAEGSGGPFRSRTSYHFEPAEGGTRLRCTIETEAAGAARLILPIVGRAVGRQMARSFVTLEAVMEAQAI
jgi:hypothetical protein